MIADVPGDAHLLRASRQQYDRPAQAFHELMQCPAQDFPYLAYWTMLGRSISSEEMSNILDRSFTDKETRLSLLESLRTLPEARTNFGYMPELAKTLARRRQEKIPLLGPLLTLTSQRAQRYKIFWKILWLRNRLFGIARYCWRHSRKWLTNQVKSLNQRVYPFVKNLPESQIDDNLSQSELEVFEKLIQARREYLQS